jgi:pimeloyl-ACP methyl ester carboxylesterase
VTEEIARGTVSARGHAIADQAAGPPAGPPVVLLHGLASDSDTWDRSLAALAGHGLRVYAVDLLGHGRSDKPIGGYLLDDFADSLGAVLDALNLSAATLCGHSLGGAIAVHFGVRYPDRVQRLVLVSSGGLGREVHPVLRAATLPVAPAVLDLALTPRLRRWYARPGLHRALRLTPENVANLRRAGRALGSSDGRAAFFASLRGVIEPAGQRGSFLETKALAEHVPTMFVWSDRDPVIPVSHAHAAHAYLPGSRLVIFPGGGHEPHRRHAERFAEEVATFVLAAS